MNTEDEKEAREEAKWEAFQNDFNELLAKHNAASWATYDGNVVKFNDSEYPDEEHYL